MRKILINIKVVPFQKIAFLRVFFLFVLFVCLFVLRLNVPVNNFSVMSGRSQRFLGLTSTVGSRCALLKDTTQ